MSRDGIRVSSQCVCLNDSTTLQSIMSRAHSTEGQWRMLSPRNLGSRSVASGTNSSPTCSVVRFFFLMVARRIDAAF
eukprot:1537142-Prymnesium_polylepis.1